VTRPLFIIRWSGAAVVLLVPALTVLGNLGCQPQEVNLVKTIADRFYRDTAVDVQDARTASRPAFAEQFTG
jgi:hypothetical protein